MVKKIMAMSLVLVMVLSFTACGESGLPSAQEIVDGVARSRPNLIAMTTHARCALSIWPIGSTADKVIHRTSNPILLVRPR